MNYPKCPSCGHRRYPSNHCSWCLQCTIKARASIERSIGAAYVCHVAALYDNTKAEYLDDAQHQIDALPKEFEGKRAMQLAVDTLR